MSEPDTESVLNHLASMPGLGHTAVTREHLRQILAQTDGQLILHGRLYEITSKHLGAGMYRISTKAAS